MERLFETFGKVEKLNNVLFSRDRFAAEQTTISAIEPKVTNEVDARDLRSVHLRSFKQSINVIDSTCLSGVVDYFVVNKYYLC